ncbi:hypothetical protein CYMTET_3977 [Cymbomonas tetramitiformis]|uniref:Uncharacterized protein n=1 Tax=Cymbomonas tetramitiformis TaxID=36881 RepID=A0AAE0H2I0_9CHLO|nr:hypothetical protein CYMTET_3977 [Cymbomonas tetramitiformis]
MVNTRLSTNATRRRNLATIFDDSAQRHAVTPPTPLATAAPAASTAAETFLATIRTLAREPFDESVATHVAKKILGGKSERFTNGESNADVLFSKLVPAIKEAFISEDPQFEPLLFDLSDATVTVRAEANRLLFSTLELIILPEGAAADWLDTSADTHPYNGKRVLFELARRLLDAGSPFSGTQTLLGVRVLSDKDPQDEIVTFNSTSARRKNTLNDEEVKGLFINALDPVYYAPVVNRSMNAFATADYELDVLASSFQDALDTNNTDKFNAFVGGAEAQTCVTFASAGLESANCANADSDSDSGWPQRPPPPVMTTEWEGTGDLVPPFKIPTSVDTVETLIPTTRLFADIVTENASQNFHNFGFADDDSGILPVDSDDESYVSDESAAEDSVVPPPPQHCFGGAVRPSFARFATPLLILALFCVCVTAAPVTTYGVGGFVEDLHKTVKKLSAKQKQQVTTTARVHRYEKQLETMQRQSDYIRRLRVQVERSLGVVKQTFPFVGLPGRGKWKKDRWELGIGLTCAMQLQIFIWRKREHREGAGGFPRGERHFAGEWEAWEKPLMKEIKAASQQILFVEDPTQLDPRAGIVDDLEVWARECLTYTEPLEPTLTDPSKSTVMTSSASSSSSELPYVFGML